MRNESDASSKAMVDTNQFSCWDALIWAAAREWGVPTLYTEDFSAGATIEGVRIVNPFTE